MPPPLFNAMKRKGFCVFSKKKVLDLLMLTYPICLELLLRKREGTFLLSLKNISFANLKDKSKRQSTFH
uniref:Uncharacterized protein n=1 Tax=Hordeum vulgare subsp. vulgare TaxID=112509 RepID=A0A8I6WU20_HORVV